MRVNERVVEGIGALEIDNGNLRVVVVPELGAKLLSLIDLRTGREWLARSDRPLRRREYAGRYDAYDYSGWDECFPGIGECFYPEVPWRGILVPDHGEVWTLPWRTELSGDVLRQAVHGVHFPYTFERTIDFSGGARLTFHYVVTNHSSFPFKTFWSTHPMLAAAPTMRFLIPDGVRVRVEVSKHGWLGEYLAVHPWPLTRDRDGNPVDLSWIGPAELDRVDKLFSTRVPEGWCAVGDETTDDFFALSFRPADVPFVGICGIRGRWPTEADSTLIGLAEPCNGWPDRLDVAIDRGEYVTIPPEGGLAWDLVLEAGRGRERLEAIRAAARPKGEQV